MTETADPGARYTDIPLFPLRSVLFPDGHLPLRIFEQRYLDMVRECARNDIGFGVCLVLDDGGTHPQTARIGTLARIHDWYTYEDGLLGITATGASRFMIENTRIRDNGLMLGEVIWLPEAAETEVPESCALLTTLTARFMEKLASHYPNYHPDLLDDASWVGYRLSEWLPFKHDERQRLLEITDPLDRLQVLMDSLPRFQS